MTALPAEDRSLRPGAHSVRELLASRANLKHLIYSMEHDRSLDAELGKIMSLKDLLRSIEGQLVTLRTFQN